MRLCSLAFIVSWAVFAVPAYGQAPPAPPTPTPSVEDQELAKLAAQLKAEGATYTVKRSPVFDAIVAQESHNIQTHAKLTGTAPPRDAASFQKALANFTGCIPPKPRVNFPTAVHVLPRATEAKWDSREQGWIPPIRNQANCGSCWDFSGIRMIETAYLKLNKVAPDSVDFSEEAVLSCSSTGACNGDWPETVFQIGKSKGIALEKDFPYQARKQACPSGLQFGVKVLDYAYVGTDSAVADTQAIKDAIKAYGGVSVAVAADSRFSGYSSGVFSGGGRGINHAVFLCGWDDADGAWIMNNSWGTSWGENGSMRIKYGSNQIGYGAAWCRVVGDSPSPGPTPPVPPAPPVPPGPNPLPPVPGQPWSGTITYKAGVIVAVTPGAADVRTELEGAGVSPLVVVDVLKLVADIKAKAGAAAIMADLLKIMADFSTADTKAEPERIAPACCGGDENLTLAP